MTTPETVADVLAEMLRKGMPLLTEYAGRLESALAGSVAIGSLVWQRDGLWKLLDDIDTQDDASKGDDAHFRRCAYAIQRRRFEYWNPESALAAQRQAVAVEPVARVAEVHMSRYTIEWTGGPLPKGTLLYGYAPPVCWQHRPGSPCPWPASCRSNGCSAVERELFPDAAQPAAPVESQPASVPDAVVLKFDDYLWREHGVSLGRQAATAALEFAFSTTPTPASVPDVIEQIAKQWDDCYYDDDLESESIGNRIRSAAKRLTTPEPTHADDR